jgi:hypothetical protein
MSVRSHSWMKIGGLTRFTSRRWSERGVRANVMFAVSRVFDGIVLVAHGEMMGGVECILPAAHVSGDRMLAVVKASPANHNRRRSCLRLQTSRSTAPRVTDRATMEKGTGGDFNRRCLRGELNKRDERGIVAARCGCHRLQVGVRKPVAVSNMNARERHRFWH